MNTLANNIRNHSIGFVTPKKAHLAWKTKAKKAVTERSDKHKKVISKAVLHRQGKNYHTSEDSSTCGWSNDGSYGVHRLANGDYGEVVITKCGEYRFCYN